MNKSIMSEEAFNELIDGFEYVGNLTDYGRKNIKYHVQKLQQENKQLKIQISAREEVCNRLESNWNKLKEYLENKIDKYSINLEYLSAERMTQIKNKMQELEKGDNNDKNNR